MLVVRCGHTKPFISHPVLVTLQPSGRSIVFVKTAPKRRKEGTQTVTYQLAVLLRVTLHRLRSYIILLITCKLVCACRLLPTRLLAVRLIDM